MPDTIIPGFATHEGTERFRARVPEIAETFNRLGQTNLLCSPVGFGTYRVDVRVAEHQAALAKAIRMGVNIIDTSSNYADGNSERLVGSVLRSLMAQPHPDPLLGKERELNRDEIIIVSKGGYIQGENLRRIENGELKIENEEYEVVKYASGLWHSIHPDFLKDQITRSLERLGLETIDVYLLHNPEYYIQWAIRDRMPEDEAREIYEARIAKALGYLETEVAAGRIKWYGISSNTFVKPEDAIDRTALERIWKNITSSRSDIPVRQQGSEDSPGRTGMSVPLSMSTPLSGNHFAVIQFPMNLYERGGLEEKNQEKASKSVIEFAKEKDLGILVNRPLNAFSKNQLIRLADFEAREYPPVQEISDLVHDLKLQEDEFRNGPLKDVAMNPQAYDAVKKLLTIGESLEGKWDQLPAYEEWRDLLFTVIKPRLQYAFDLLRDTVKSDKALFQSLQEYAESIDELMEHITNFYLTKASERSQAIHAALDEILPDEYQGLSLSQKAILMLRSIDGVSSVLIGMRSDEYVEDVMYGLQARKLLSAQKAWEELAL